MGHAGDGRERKTALTDILLIALLVWNLVVFLLYGVDKAKAKRGSRRIPEKTLLWCAFLLGGIGGMAGMLVFRHKTQHTKFRILLPLALILTLAAVGAYTWFFVL